MQALEIEVQIDRHDVRLMANNYLELRVKILNHVRDNYPDYIAAPIPVDSIEASRIVVKDGIVRYRTTLLRRDI